MMEKEMKQHPKLPVRSIGNSSEGDLVAKLGAFLGDLADVFGDGADMLSELADCLQEDSDLRDVKDIRLMDASVLYAVPGVPAQLMTEEEALSKFPGFEEEQTFHCFAIQEHLYLYYMECAWESEEEITITAPVFVSRVSDDETESVELTARDFVAAIAFLNDHTTTLADETGTAGYGFWLPKED